MTTPDRTRTKNATSRAVATGWQAAAATAIAAWASKNELTDLLNLTEAQVEAGLLTVIASALAWVKNWVKEL